MLFKHGKHIFVIFFSQVGFLHTNLLLCAPENDHDYGCQ